MRNVMEYLDNYRGEPVSAWMRQNLEIPSIVTVLYIVMVLYVPNKFMKHRPAYNLRTLNIMWNLFLSVFSFCGAYYCIPQVMKAFFAPTFEVRNYEQGGTVTLHGSVYNGMCNWDDNLFCDGPVGAFVSMFILSKIPEMIDTAFLVFQKKRVIFLHWYHHVTVMLYCWHSYAVKISGGLVFAGMNYGVHSIMYLYFFICACGYRKLVRPFAPIITFLQIAQMIVGMVVEAITLYHMYLSGKGCHSNETNARVGLLMYVSYFLLFSKLFYDNYMSGEAAAVPSSISSSSSSSSNNTNAHGGSAKQAGHARHHPSRVTPHRGMSEPLVAAAAVATGGAVTEAFPVKRRH